MNNETKLPTSPDWTTAPEGATHFAVDINGDGFYYSICPIITTFQWTVNNLSARIDYAGEFDATDWANSLQKRPEQ